MSELVIRTRYRPHPGQLAFHMAPSGDPRIRFRMVAPGRRWGKTFAGANETIRVATSGPPGNVGFVIAPSYSSTSLGKCWRAIKYYAPRELVKRFHKTPGNMFVEWIGDRLTLFRSAESPESCEGEGISYAWFDEPGKMKSGETWDTAVMPSLMDTDGVAWFTGTPTPRAKWYKLLFDKGRDRAANPEYWSRGGSSYENTLERGGYLKKSSIDAIAVNLSERSRRQNIYAEWLEDMGCLFRRVRDHVVHEYDSAGNKREFSNYYMGKPRADKRYSVGADLAKHQDWTVVLAVDEEGCVVGFERFHQVDWTLQQKRVVSFAERWNNARILIDSHGVGDSVYDDMRRMGANVDGYNIRSNLAKCELVENLSLLMENNKVSFPNIVELVNELQVFGYYTKESGTTVYEAPEGYHDDAVIALALALYQVSRPKGFWA